MAGQADLKSDAVLVPRPECNPGPLHEGCSGPPPTPWLSWKHCFKIYEFREYVVRLEQATAALAGNQDPRAVRACAVSDGPQAGADRPQPHLAAGRGSQDLRIRPLPPRHQHVGQVQPALLVLLVREPGDRDAGKREDRLRNRILQIDLGRRVRAAEASTSASSASAARRPRPRRCPSATTSTSIRSSSRSATWPRSAPRPSRPSAPSS